MTIKQSSLESKWYYRVLKTLLLIVPLLLVLVLFLTRRTVACIVTFGGLPDLTTLILIALGVIFYYVLLRTLWRTALYIIFGGVEDDTRGGLTSGGPGRSAKGLWIIAIIIVIVAAVLIAAQQGYITLPRFLTDITKVKSGPGPSCPATSAQTSTPCGSVKGGVGVSGVIVRSTCNCPSDTVFSGMDNITAGGPYRMCTCR